MVCIDTNLIIDFMDGDPEVIGLLEYYTQTERLSTTSMSQYEILKYNGLTKKTAAAEWTSKLTIHDFDTAAATEAANIFLKLKESGRMINENDILIAAIAISNNELLITRDKKFANIESQKILIV